MADRYPPTVQRPELLKLAAAIDSRSSALQRDECSDWQILGARGKIYAVPIGKGKGFQIIIYVCRSEARKALSAFTRPEGYDYFFLDHLPTAEEGAVIRHYLGIPKARHLSEERREQARETLSKFAFKARAEGEAHKKSA